MSTDVSNEIKLPQHFKFSWSAIIAYFTCPLSFKHQYILKEVFPTNLFALSGCAVHELLKHIYEIKNFNIKYAFKIFANIFYKELKTVYKQEQYSSLSDTEIEKAKQIGFAQLKQFFNLAEKEKLLRPSLFNDLTIVRKYRGYPCKVRIDTAFKFDNFPITLVDWKGAKESRKYIYQLVFYSAVFEKEKNIKVDAIAPIYFNSPLKIIPLTIELRKEASNFITKITNDIFRGNFEPKKNEYCGTCTLKLTNRCPLWT